MLPGCVVLAFAGCVVAVVAQARWVGDAVVYLSALVAVPVLLGRSRPVLRGWPLFGVALLTPGLGGSLTILLDPDDPLELTVLRGLTSVPALLLVIVAVLTLVPSDHLRRGGRRTALELLLFTSACMVVMQLLVIGPDGHWGDLAGPDRAVLGAAVIATSGSMAAALTVLGVVEQARERMAVTLLGGMFLTAAGCGLSTLAQATGHGIAEDLARFCIVGGLALICAARLQDPGPAPVISRAAERQPATGRTTELGQVLPHVAMMVAVTVVVATMTAGHRPDSFTLAGATACVILAAVHRAVTAREEQSVEERLRRSEAYFRSLVSSSGDAVVILDDALRVTWCSAALERILGDTAGDLVGRFLLEAVHPEDAAGLRATLDLPATAAGEQSPEPVLQLMRLRAGDGAWRHLETGVSDLRADADVGAVVLHCRDVTDRHDREQTLHSVAYTDPRTGLPNRAGCLRALEAALSSSGIRTTLLLLELDGLAEAREHAGQEVSQTVVAEVGRRLRGTVRSTDVVARMRGGLFAVVAAAEDDTPTGSAAEIDQLAARCLAVVERPIVTAAGVLDLTASVGLAPLEPGQTVDGVLAAAGLALAAAHASGTGLATRYRPALGEAAIRRDRLRLDVQGAGERGELFLLFQPIVSTELQAVTGLEAQLRWRHPALGEIPPMEFLPIAERAGVIGELVRWALEESTSVVVGLPDVVAPLRFGLKVPQSWFATGTAVADVRRALERSGLSAERLALQIGEATVTADDERTAMDLTTLRLMGVHVALVGFGAGSSALSHLTRVPIDILTLDRSLLARIDRDRQSRALCESVVGIGRALGLDVVAEGVETPAQLALLRGAGCGFVQGTVISRPLDAGKLRTLLEERAGQLWPGLVASG